MSDRIPSYRRHRQSGQAIVTLPDGFGNRRDVLLGKYGTAESRKEYARVISEWEAAGQRLPPKSAESSAPDLTINELCLAYWRHVEAYYVKDGRPTSEQHVVRCALRYVKQLYGHTPARDFGPLALKAVRQKLIEHPIVRKVKVIDPETGEVREQEKLLQRGLARRNINKLVGRIKRMFSWAVEEELLPARRDGRSVWDWLLYAFGAAAVALQAAGPKRTLREFVDTLIQGILDKRALPLQGARQQLWNITWTNLLDLDCQTCAGLLRETVEIVRGYWDRDQEERQQSRENKGKGFDRADRGFLKKVRTPRPFPFNGKLYHFGYRQSLLLECLTDKASREPSDEEDHSVVSVLTAIGHVWGWFAGEADAEGRTLAQMENRLHQLQRETNNSLKRAMLPLAINRPRFNHLQLIRVPAQKI
jgi:hypothetical protein